MALHEVVLTVIADFVDSSDYGPYQEKKRRLLESVTERERTALMEFVSWFNDEPVEAASPVSTETPPPAG